MLGLAPVGIIGTEADAPPPTPEQVAEHDARMARVNAGRQRRRAAMLAAPQVQAVLEVPEDK